MPQNKTLILIQGKAQANLVPRIKKKLGASGELVTVTFDNFAEERLAQLSQDYKTLSDFPLELDQVFAEANSVAKEWHYKFSDQEFKGLVNYDDTPIGALVQYWLGRVVSGAFRDMQTVLSLVEQEKPQEIVAVSDGGTLEAAARLVAGHKNVRLTLLSPDLLTKVKATLSGIRGSIMWTSYYLLRRLCFVRPKHIHPQSSRSESSVLLISTYGVHSSILRPVLRELQGQTGVLYCDMQLVPLTLKRWFRIVRTAFNPLNYLSYHRLAGLAGMWRRNRKVKQSWQRLSQRRDFTESFNYKGIPVWPLLSPLFHRLFKDIMPDLIEYVVLTEGLLQKQRIGVVVTCDDVSYDVGAIIATAKKHGIHGLMLQHGVLQARNLSDTYAGISDKVAVWGDVARDFFLSQGVPEDKVVITGSPQFDSILQTYSKYRKRKREKPGYQILLATQPFDPSLGESLEDNRTFAESVAGAVAKVPSARLIIKLHPNEWRGVHRKIYDGIERIAGGKVSIMVDVNLYRLLAESDLVITKGSTVGLEAMLLSKPVIEADFTGRLENTSRVAGGAVLRVSKAEELEAAIQSALSDTQVQKQMQAAAKDYIYKQAYLQDGQAARRVAELILSMLGEKAPK